MTEDADAFDPDPDRVETLRKIAEEIRGESSESKLVAATLYRISDLYDPDEETSPRDIYLNMREILRTKDASGKGR